MDRKYSNKSSNLRVGHNIVTCTSISLNLFAFTDFYRSVVGLSVTNAETS
jgi:hypothetical protein